MRARASVLSLGSARFERARGRSAVTMRPRAVTATPVSPEKPPERPP